ncbi:hypothetical protein ABKN59_001325 [Abortiporus biennis]
MQLSLVKYSLPERYRCSHRSQPKLSCVHSRVATTAYRLQRIASKKRVPGPVKYTSAVHLLLPHTIVKADAN